MNLTIEVSQDLNRISLELLAAQIAFLREKFQGVNPLQSMSITHDTAIEFGKTHIGKHMLKEEIPAILTGVSTSMLKGEGFDGIEYIDKNTRACFSQILIS